MNEVVSVDKIDDIGLVSLNNPPVNAAGHALRSGLVDAIEQLDKDPNVSVIVVYAEGKTFIAGADITEFGKPSKDPILPEVCNKVEASNTPVVAVLHGTALGGGLEVAMSAHARVALPSTRVGLPEINLGIFPGAGGTQRTPRLVGWEMSLDMILSGRQVTAEEAMNAGLVDKIIDGTPRDVAIAAGKAVLDGTLKTKRTRDVSIAQEPEIFAGARSKVEKKSPLLFAPKKAIQAVEMASGDIEAGLKLERELFVECMQSDQSKALIHAFFADRAVQKIPEASAQARKVESVGIIGGGTMGSGIGTAMLLSGLHLTLVEMNDEAAERARSTIINNLDGAVKRGKMKQDVRDDVVHNRLTITVNFDDLSECDLIIEAVFEDMDVKKDIFSKLDNVAKAGAILASNTSYLDINQIASATNRPSDVIGLHFFSPAHIMRLLEVVVADKTSPEVVASGFALAKRIKKIAVRAEVCDGFIGNRILRHYAKVVLYLVEDGATPEQVDNALEAFGLAMGPFAVADLAGLDIGWAARKRLAKTRPVEERDVEIPDRICERGWFGRKTGMGYYIYEGRERRPNPEVAEIIAAERAKNNITVKSFTDEQIVERYMTAMILEAARVVEDGTALRPVDVDAVLLNGYGFPRFRGGPLHYADTIGVDEIIKRAEKYAEEDAYYWRVPKILYDMVKTGDSFSNLNRK